jgi:phosphoribosyl-ATP pyrophosphohydrolase
MNYEEDLHEPDRKHHGRAVCRHLRPQAKPKEGSYTNYLFDKGVDKICKKIGEEAAEVIIAAKNNNAGEIIYEVSDLLYHLNVLLVQSDIPLDSIYAELKKAPLIFCLTRSLLCGKFLFAHPQEGSFFMERNPIQTDIDKAED